MSRHFGTSAKMSYGQFGTGTEVSWVQSVLGPKCLYSVVCTKSQLGGLNLPLPVLPPPVTASAKHRVVITHNSRSTLGVLDHPNYKPVRNLQHRVTSASCLSNDRMANVHDLAYNLPDFIWLVLSFHNLTVITRHQEI